MLNNILFLLIWLIVPWLWFYILKLGGLELMKLSLPSFVVLSIFIFQYLGFPILYFGLDEYRAEYVTNQDLLLNAWLFTSISTVLICLGAVVASLLLNPLDFFKYNDKLLLPNYMMRRIYIVGIFCLAVLIGYLIKVGIENIAILAVFNGADSKDVALARSLMGNDFGGGYHWFNFFMRDCLIFISLTLIASKLQGSKFFSGYTFVIVSATIFSLIMATEKGLFVDFSISVVLIYIITKYRGEVPKFAVFNLTIFLIISLIIFYIYFMGDASVASGALSVFSRGFTGSLQPIYHYLEFFPMHQNWLYGTTFPNPGGLFPFTPYNLTVEVMNFVQPEHYESGIVGSMPAIYWGELYANFGYFGVLLMPIFVGFGLYFINWILYKKKFNPLNAALFAWLLIHYKNLSVTSLSMFVFDFNLILMLAVFYLIRSRFV